MAGAFAQPMAPDEVHEPFDERVATLHLAGELDELNYDDLVLEG